MVVPAVLLLSLGFLDCSHPPLAVFILTTGMAMRGFRFSGFIVNAIDITPHFGGVVFGITNTMASFGAYSTLMVASRITTNLSREGWQTVFFITSAVEIFGSLFYLIFASADVQSWNGVNNCEIIVETSKSHSDTETNHI